MKIIALADEENRAFWDFYDPDRFKGVDLILSCGDLHQSYLEFLETMTNVPLLYVRGNHDRSYTERPPEGCVDVDDRIYDFRGLRILGLGGSMRYKPGGDMYTEEEMERRIRKLNRTIVLRNGFDILLTHAPARGYGDMNDLPHQGFECFNRLLERWKPAYMLFGHVHRTYGDFVRMQDHPSGARLINAYDYVELDIGDDEHPAHGKTGSALYDLYISISSRRGHSGN